MRTDIDLLRKMIKSNSIIEAERKEGNVRLILVEDEDNKTAKYSVEIYGLPEECIAIKSDNFAAQRDFFNNKNGQLRRADYILIAIIDNQCWAVFIELKQGKADSRRVREQLKGAECLLDYCRSLGRSFWNNQSFLDLSDSRSRFVCIRDTKFSKRSTRVEDLRLGEHLRPEKMLLLNGQSHNFRRLLGF